MSLNELSFFIILDEYYKEELERVIKIFLR